MCQISYAADINSIFFTIKDKESPRVYGSEFLKFKIFCGSF